MHGKDFQQVSYDGPSSDDDKCPKKFALYFTCVIDPLQFHDVGDRILLPLAQGPLSPFPFFTKLLLKAKNIKCLNI